MLRNAFIDFTLNTLYRLFLLLFTRVREINIKLADTDGKIVAGSFSTGASEAKSRIRRTSAVSGGKKGR